MGWLEWLGESLDPQSWGSVYFGGEPDDQELSVPSVVARCVIAVALMALCYFLLFRYGVALTMKAVAWTVGLTVGYLVVAYFVRPEPETDNLGWLGGLMDDPFHYSDDISRFLLFLLIILWPGRFVAVSLVQLGRVLRR